MERPERLAPRLTYGRGVETRRLGRTEHMSSVAILGAAAFARSDEESTERAFAAALDAGVNHLDIAPTYGQAEELVGLLVPAVRDRLFVGCKTGRKNPDGVRAQLEESLRKLGCASFDLYQLHGVVSVDELDRRADAVATILRARDEGLCRHVGITGHDVGAPGAAAEAIRRYDVDTVMFPINPRFWADENYRRDAEGLLALAAERDVGVMVIKAAAARPWGTTDRWATTWYEPRPAGPELELGVRFALSTPGVAGFCTPGDIALLTDALRAVAGGEGIAPMDDDERSRAIEAAAAEPLLSPLAALA